MRAIPTEELWNRDHLKAFSVATQALLKSQGVTHECRFSNSLGDAPLWWVKWNGGGLLRQVVACRWAYPGLWRIHCNRFQNGPGPFWTPFRMSLRLGLQLPDSWPAYSPPQPAWAPEQSEVTCLGEELASLAGYALALASGLPSEELEDDPARPLFSGIHRAGIGYDWTDTAGRLYFDAPHKYELSRAGGVWLETDDQ